MRLNGRLVIDSTDLWALTEEQENCLPNNSENIELLPSVPVERELFRMEETVTLKHILSKRHMAEKSVSPAVSLFMQKSKQFLEQNNQ